MFDKSLVSNSKSKGKGIRVIKIKSKAKSMSKAQKLDVGSPEFFRLYCEMCQKTFLNEGTMVAFPLCFPGNSMPITADESRITALDVADDGAVYGGTSGRATHLFVGMFHGVTGMVLDMGKVDGADSCTAICCGQEKFIACVNGPSGGQIVMRELEHKPFDLIQEWQIYRTPYENLGRVVEGEIIIHAVTDSSRQFVIGITERHLFTVEFDSGNVEVVGDIIGTGRLAIGNNGNIYGRDKANTLWQYETGIGKIIRKAYKLPEKGKWNNGTICWARKHAEKMLYTADDEGNIFAFTIQRGFSGPLGRTMLAPVGPMVVTSDGRIFGFCGEEIAKMFCYTPETGEITNLGAAVSVIERRRYGFEFADAVVGRDGQIYFGENDNLGHLWIYFPAIQACRNEKTSV
jgi:outer membrane protein assembly factor BamB